MSLEGKCVIGRVSIVTDVLERSGEIIKGEIIYGSGEVLGTSGEKLVNKYGIQIKTLVVIIHYLYWLLYGTPNIQVS